MNDCNDRYISNIITAMDNSCCRLDTCSSCERLVIAPIKRKVPCKYCEEEMRKRIAREYFEIYNHPKVPKGMMPNFDKGKENEH